MKVAVKKTADSIDVWASAWKISFPSDGLSEPLIARDDDPPKIDERPSELQMALSDETLTLRVGDWIVSVTGEGKPEATNVKPVISRDDTKTWFYRSMDIGHLDPDA